VYFVVGRGKKLSRGFTVYNQNFDIDIGRATLRLNFYVTIRRAACEASSATWNLSTNSAFALRLRKTTENLDPIGPASQKIHSSPLQRTTG
jgi:hypothetical protein